MARKVAAAKVHPVILSGGAGSRLWPLSRELYPKQLLALTGELSLLQQTAMRVGDAKRFGPPLVICNNEHRFAIAEQLQQIGIAPLAIVLEPEGRNTAPAATVAALMLQERVGPDTIMLLLPSDHLVQDQAAFLAAAEKAAEAAAEGSLVTFGIKPTAPETGFGYIKRGGILRKQAGVYKVDRFVEKPNLKTAKSYLDSGDYSWNSGMFMLPVRAFLTELERLEPGMLEACRQAIAAAQQDLDFCRLDGKAFARAASRSIDVAVMEHTDQAAVVPADMGWTDVGSWSALWDIADKDKSGNSLIGDVMVEDTQNSYVRSDGALTAVLGLRDVVVVNTEDAVLVASRDRSQDVKLLVERLKKSNRSEHLVHRRIHRPWGWYQTVDDGDRFQVKHIMVKPGHSLSLQKHFHRAEHWIVVYGVAQVTRGEDSLIVPENESVFIPLGTKHRLANPGKLPLRLIEVQSGSYLGEDDIVRFEDHYGRS